MGHYRLHSWFPWIALASIVGILSVATDASACVTTEGANALRGCCIAHPFRSCDCCGSASSTTPAFHRHSAATWSASASAPLVTHCRFAASPASCRCHAEAPADPASKAGHRASEGRTGSGPVVLVGIASFSARPSLPSTCPAAFSVSTLRTPLFLRTSRLLF